MRIIKVDRPTTNSATLPTLQEGMMLPEKEEYRIELFKDERRGLGITVAGYVCEKGKAARGRFGSGSCFGSHRPRPPPPPHTTIRPAAACLPAE